MASFMDSGPVFRQRMSACGVTDAAVKKLEDANITTLAKLAYCCSYTPNQPNEAPLVTFFEATVGDGQPVDAGILACLRRVYVEAHTFMLAELKGKIERKEDESPRKVPQPERNARLDEQRGRLIGLSLTGVNEPSNNLIDLVAQQKEDEVLRYIDLEFCTSREMEMRSSKPSKTKADVSSDLLVRQALMRRNLAYDQMEIIRFECGESWTTFLFMLMMREPVKEWNQITLAQILEADKQMFILASEVCRDGITKRPGQTIYPVEGAFETCRSDPLIMSLLQPLPGASDNHRKRAGKGEGSDDGNDKKRTKTRKDQTIKVKKETAGKGSGKTKGKMPKPLIGMNFETKDGNRICFSFNISGCTDAEAGGKCNKGCHVCAKCLGPHSVKECKE